MGHQSKHVFKTKRKIVCVLKENFLLGIIYQFVPHRAQQVSSKPMYEWRFLHRTTV